MYIKYKTDTLELRTVSPEMPSKTKGYTIVEKPEVTTTDIKIYRSSEGIMIEKLSDEEKQSVDRYRFEQAKRKLQQRISRLRYLAETSGVEWNGITIGTDEVSQAKLNRLITYFNLNPDATVSWKGKNSWVTLNKDQVIEIVHLVSQHIESYFDTEKQIQGQTEQAKTMNDLVKIQIPDEWKRLEESEDRNH